LIVLWLSFGFGVVRLNLERGGGGWGVQRLSEREAMGEMEGRCGMHRYGIYEDFCGLAGVGCVLVYAFSIYTVVYCYFPLQNNLTSQPL
jgi:hypothetical protein